MANRISKHNLHEVELHFSILTALLAIPIHSCLRPCWPSLHSTHPSRRLEVPSAEHGTERSCWRSLPAAPQPAPVCCPSALVVIQRGRGCLLQAVPLPASVLVTLSYESCTALGTNSCEAADHRGSAVLKALLQMYKEASGCANRSLACSQGTSTQVSLLPSSNKPTSGNPSCWQQANLSCCRSAYTRTFWHAYC